MTRGCTVAHVGSQRANVLLQAAESYIKLPCVVSPTGKGCGGWRFVGLWQHLVWLLPVLRDGAVPVVGEQYGGSSFALVGSLMVVMSYGP